MAFPSTFNITYYEGDTYEFKIFPKNSVGGSFNLSGYTPKFVIATARGVGDNVVQFICNARINPDNSVSCEITPAQGRDLVAGVSYIYDVEVKNNSVVTDTLAVGKTFTLLTGNVSVTADVSGAA